MGAGASMEPGEDMRGQAMKIVDTYATPTSGSNSAVINPAWRTALKNKDLGHTLYRKTKAQALGMLPSTVCFTLLQYISHFYSVSPFYSVY